MSRDDEDEDIDFTQPVEVPIDGTLDLHTFRPREVKDLVRDYLGLCLEQQIFEVRIIHGKGTGALRAAVHAVLDRIPMVASYRLAGDRGGNWGATVVLLRRDCS